MLKTTDRSLNIPKTLFLFMFELTGRHVASEPMTPGSTIMKSVLKTELATAVRLLTKTMVRKLTDRKKPYALGETCLTTTDRRVLVTLVQNVETVKVSDPACNSEMFTILVVTLWLWIVVKECLKCDCVTPCVVRVTMMKTTKMVKQQIRNWLTWMLKNLRPSNRLKLNRTGLVGL